MKAKELRIGNLVEINAPIINKVIAVDVYHISKIKKNKDCCKPIPLTEEWLVNFGFYEREFSFDKGSFYLTKRIGEKAYLYQETKSPFRVEFVHQLQNLYFALTGEELTLKQ